jgi:hypothetical protein
MKQYTPYAVVSLLLAATAMPTFAAQHYVVDDGETFCAVLDALPSPASGIKILGDHQGYTTKGAAEQALKANPACKG